jgi:hypothetical protein
LKKKKKKKNKQQPKLWPTTPSAYRSVGDSPLYSSVLQGGFRRQFNILHPEALEGAGHAGKRSICTF